MRIAVTMWASCVLSAQWPDLAEFPDEPLNSPRCGRPLGLRFDQRGRLLVADAYLGIHRVNVTSGNTEPVLVTQNRQVTHMFSITSETLSATSANGGLRHSLSFLNISFSLPQLMRCKDC